MQMNRKPSAVNIYELRQVTTREIMFSGARLISTLSSNILYRVQQGLQGLACRRKDKVQTTVHSLTHRAILQIFSYVPQRDAKLITIIQLNAK